MEKIGRQKFLKYGALGGAALLLSGAEAGVASQTVFWEAPAVPIPIDRFRVYLPVPPVLQPVRADAATNYYELTRCVGRAELLPGYETEVWGYDGVFPAPRSRGALRAAATSGWTRRWPTAGCKPFAAPT